MANLQLRVAMLATWLFAVMAGCSKPGSAPIDAVGQGVPVQTTSNSPPVARPSVERVAFEQAAEDSSRPVQDPISAAEPATDAAAHCQRRLLAFVDEARVAASLLDQHGATESFDQQCAKLKDLLERIESANEDGLFDEAAQHANLILLQLKLGRVYLRQRDEMDGMNSPGAMKLLRDVFQQCSRLARQLQQEISDLKREVASE